mmetsp:Transcript_22529/g.59487  ORF Transcript_22529/g.59487 Transcript_22529/m.59487 type:complete len:208 (-) Transcript_22529:207-830(-)
MIGILTNLRHRCLVQVFQSIRLHVILNVLRELSFVPGGILLLQHFHVLRHMVAQNSGLVRFCVIGCLSTFIFCRSVARELFGCVRHVQTSINSSLQGSPHATTCNSPSNSDIQDALHWSLIIFFIFDVELLSVGFFVPFERISKSEMLQCSTRSQKTSQVCSSVILQTCFDSILGKLHRRRLRDNLVSQDGCISNLHDDLAIREPHN